MSDVFIDQSQTITKTTKKVETEIKQTFKNINVDLSKLDMSGSIESFKRLEEVSKAVNFDGFIAKIATLQETFLSFQKAVQSANTSVTNFSKSSDKINGGNTAIVQNVEVNTGDISGQIGDISSDISANVGDMTAGISQSVSTIGDCFSSVGTGVLDFGNGIASAVNSISGLIGSVSNLLNSFESFGNGLVTAASGITSLISLLPQLGSSILQMAVNMSGVLAYVPELVVFLGVLLVLSLLGEGLMAAGTGLVNIGLGLTSMTAGMTALLTFMPTFIASLAGITDNIGGIILFVLLAAAMLAMAIALQMMNEQMANFCSSMEKLNGIMSVGFVAAFVVFGAMLMGMSMFMTKVASGMDKITQSMDKQIAKLAILNPLLAAQAILSNPIVGGITVAAAIVGGLLVKSLIPAMATGGIVSSPTVAMVGEGRYPEAVVPLGDSPQFASMKAEIANAVLQGISATNTMSSGAKGKNLTVQLHIDGRQFAETTVRDFVETLNNEGYGVVRADAVYR